MKGGMERRTASWLLAATALLLLPALGGTDLWAPDEPRYAQVAEELRSLEHGPTGLAVLRLNGEVYTQKPPLYFWLAALLGAPGGHVGEVAARLPSAVSGWLCIALALRLGTSMFGAGVGRAGAALLLTVFTFAWFARRAQLDVMLCLFEMLALAAFWRIDRSGAARGRDLAVLHGAMGLAVLTKGPVGLLLPLLTIAATLAWERRLRTLRGLLLVPALALSLGPGLLWLSIAVAAAPTGYFGDAVVANLFDRFFLGTEHDRPLTYYFYQFPANFLPWTLLWPLVAWAPLRHVFADGGDPDRARAWRFLLVWVATSFVFFSLSSGKRGIYMLPAFPAVALLCADATRLFLAERGGVPRWISRALLALALLLALAALVAGEASEALFGVPIPRAFGLCIALAMAASVLAWSRGPTTWPRPAVAIAAVFACELAVFTLLFPALDEQKSPRPVANAAARITAPGEVVGVVGKHSLVGGLRYYGDRAITVLDAPGDVQRFVADGGRVMVVTQRRLEQVRGDAPIEIRSRWRSGRRSLYVVSVDGGDERRASGDP